MLLAGDLEMGHARALLLALDGAAADPRGERDRRQEAQRRETREARRAAGHRNGSRQRRRSRCARTGTRRRDMVRIEQELGRRARRRACRDPRQEAHRREGEVGRRSPSLSASLDELNGLLSRSWATASNESPRRNIRCASKFARDVQGSTRLAVNGYRFSARCLLILSRTSSKREQGPSELRAHIRALHDSR